jgi:hypothetical protein
LRSFLKEPAFLVTVLLTLREGTPYIPGTFPEITEHHGLALAAAAALTA